MKKYLPEGYIFDTRENKEALKNLSSLEIAFKEQKQLEAKATMCDSSHNLIVDLNGIKGVIPREEGAIGIAEGTVRDIALISKVGKPVSFVITDIEYGEKTVCYLSRKLAQEKAKKEYLDFLSTGDIIDAAITHLEPFGAFCDIACGIPSLLPIDSISISRISHPKDRFSPDDRIKAVVKSIENGRFTLSQKELLGSWEENASLFEAGETVSGIIRSVEDYGVFVELMPNLAGLAEPKDNVFPSQNASVYIKSIIPEKMKIKLIIIDSFDTGNKTKCDKYFYKGEHIDNWQYSPETSEKLIKSVF
ncbi:MAG: S1 RNA-binding domain-containing protein [Clostridia bacterium]|nr:S1 RNA-binding domain-containing protein [Clostridia bacterium]